MDCARAPLVEFVQRFRCQEKNSSGKRRNPMEHRLKQIHAEMSALRHKEASGIKLSREERSRLEQLAEERDELARRIVFHTP
jgi:hypothetical protein